MVTKEELKQLLIALGKKWLFPDFTNKLTWLVVSVGCAIVLTPTPFKVLFFNWLVETVNLNNGTPFTLAEIQSSPTDSIIGVALIAFALLHNVGSRYFNYLASNQGYRVEQQERDADIAVYQRFIADFPSNSSSINLLKEHDFGNSYHDSSTQQVENFVIHWNDAEHQFLDGELEAEKKKLWAKCREFVNRLAEYSGPIGNGPLFSVIPDMHRGNWDIPDFITERIRELNQKATECYELHQALVSLCRKKLKC